MGSLFDGIENAPISSGGVYALPGVYEVELIKVFLISARKGYEAFIVEYEVLESDNDERRPGMRLSWVVNMSQDPALGNVKAFLASALNCAPEEISAQVAKDAVGDDNPLAGIKLRLEASQITTRAGNPFTKHNWSSLRN